MLSLTCGNDLKQTRFKLLANRVFPPASQRAVISFTFGGVEQFVNGF